MIWYVNSKDGSDASDGRTIHAAFRTLAHAIAVATSGDTIMLVPGTYEQNLPQKVGEARGLNLNVTVAGSSD
jgi:Protein of unknown function (DUF1565)